MNKVKFLSIVAIGLLITNLLLIGFIIRNNSNRQKHEGPRNIVIEKLNFDEQQIDEYDKLIQWHQVEIIKSQEQMMSLKNQLYGNLIKNNSVNIKDSLISELITTQAKIENTHYKHFEDIKKLCKEEQQQNFKDLTLEIADLFAPPKMKRLQK